VVACFNFSLSRSSLSLETVACARSSYPVLEQGKCQSISNFPAGNGPCGKGASSLTCRKHNGWGWDACLCGSRVLKTYKKVYTLTILLP